MEGSHHSVVPQKDIQVKAKINCQHAQLNRFSLLQYINLRLKPKMAMKNSFQQMVTISRLSMMCC